ncbi:sugar O-acetyltransferase [Akkermansia sp.]|uniref:sugar O-acetyltransferase n=1 Tax=Akkermansia sp. TaxID=1872421 RepID=UPI0025C1F2E6|nr:sugar O-acetyltransferase [Akkermansia sp.]MCC8148123.1 sugar O-acetyltransferase [Akkermansia sp.]
MASKDWNNMLAGRLYHAQDPDLTAARLRARQLVFRYNQSAPGEEGLRREVAAELFGRMGEGCYLEPPLRCDYGFNIRMGDRVYINFNLVVLDCAAVTIGNDVLIGPNVGIYTAGHPVDPGLRREGLEFALPVTIEDGVWIGGHAVIAPGVRIGRNSVIGAGSVVTKDIPANVVAVGNPCRVIRPITEKDREAWQVEKSGNGAAAGGTEANSPV